MAIQKAAERDYFGMEREDYLQTIYRLEALTGEARISDLARVLKIKKPSASQMVERLEKQGYVSHKPYAGMHLTKKGKKAAEHVIARHEALADFFTTLGISKKIQEHDIHGIEHYLSPVTLNKLQALTKLLKEMKR
jgi:DtxR family manganese transport transcriptional regulator